MTAALEGGEWSAARPGRTLLPGKTRYPFYRRLSGPQGRSGRAEYLVASTGIRSRTVQPVVSHYTDWATGPTYIYIYICYKTNFYYKVNTLSLNYTKMIRSDLLKIASTSFLLHIHKIYNYISYIVTDCNVRIKSTVIYMQQKQGV